MSTDLPTVSRLPIVARCQASAALAQSHDEGSDASRKGDALHAYLAAYASIPGDRDAAREKALQVVPKEWLDACWAIPLEHLPPLDPESVLPEVAFALKLDLDFGTMSTARVLSVNGGRDYSGAQPGELV